MVVDPVGLNGMNTKIRTYLASIDLDNVTRKNHNKILYELAHLFRSVRSIQHKRYLVR